MSESRIPAQAPRPSELPDGEAKAELLEALNTMYGHTVKLAKLSTGRWAVFDREYCLRAILASPPSEAEAEELWAKEPPPRRAEPQAMPVRKGTVSIDLDELFGA